MPCFTAPLHEYNDCHEPAGSRVGGRFCSTGTGATASSRSGRGPLSAYLRPEDSIKIPAYLKDDVARAMRAGIVTYHRQQPEPVRTSTGEIVDPLALSHAGVGEHQFRDPVGFWVKAKRGRVQIMTRGGEFEPLRDTYNSEGWPSGKEKKELTPEMLPEEAKATELDVISTFRHEVGHLLDREYGGKKSTPEALARELRAWVYAMEISPDHTLSERMMRSGLESHSYFEYRRLDLLKQAREQGFRIALWDEYEWSVRQVRNELKDNVMDAPTLERAKAFATKAITKIQNYGKLLKKKGLVRVPQPVDPWFPEVKRPKPGPGRSHVI